MQLLGAPFAVVALGAVSQQPTRPVLLQTFTAIQSGYSVATGAVNNTISGQVTVDASVPGQFQEQGLPDGRSVSEIFNYDIANLSNAGVFSLQPFFDEKVCYIYPLPIGRGYKPLVFADALVELWCQQAGLCMVEYDNTKYMGMGNGVDGTPCQLWEYGTSINETTTFCVTAAGALLDVAFDYHDGHIDVVARTHFSNFSTTVNTSKFIVPGDRLECVDLRASRNDSDRQVNSVAHIETANKEAKGVWHAAPTAVFEGYTLENASLRLGLKDGFGFGLPPPSAAHTAALQALDIPDSFDAREQWGNACNSVTKVRNQGDCGGCWAFSAVETLADRICIAASSKSTFANLSLSPQWILDCDKTDNGCGGGLLDDAWRFLKSTGVVEETCDPYIYCAHPVSPSCETGPHPPRPTPSAHTCPSHCNASSALSRQYKAESAYAVAKPGDVASMQREIMVHGPIQVGFQVFSDFMTYHNGTYFRTPSAQGPRGGHAVKIVGWGVDASQVPYWIVANSWSPLWGNLGGFFHIRRGTNECGIETTPAAGLPQL